MANGLPKATPIPPDGMDTNSPEWLELCQGYFLLNMDSVEQQRSFLERWEKRNGKTARQKLERLLRQMSQWWTESCRAQGYPV